VRHRRGGSAAHAAHRHAHAYADAYAHVSAPHRHTHGHADRNQPADTSPGPGTPTAIATATGTATASPAPVLLPADTPVPTLRPAQIPGGVSVTINVAPNRAYAGQMVEVSGQGAPGYAKVRILSVQGGRTVGSSEAPVDGQGAYKLNLRVPPGQPVGPTQLCAAPWARPTRNWPAPPSRWT
jgi:hypothetical protein